MNSPLSLVTGANRGLGLEFTRHLLQRGEQVVAACRTPGKAVDLNRLAAEHPHRLHVLPFDAASAASIAELVRELPLVLGDGGRVQRLINNAGVLHSGERFGTLQADPLLDSFRINAIAPLLLLQAVAPLLADGARVGNVSSVMGSIAGTDAFRSPGYGASKAAQNMFTVQAARALAPRGIVVLALHPGWVHTDMGGDSAPVSPTESVRGLLQVLDSANAAQSGHFLDWTGASLPW